MSNIVGRILEMVILTAMVLFFIAIILPFFALILIVVTCILGMATIIFLVSWMTGTPIRIIQDDKVVGEIRRFRYIKKDTDESK